MMPRRGRLRGRRDKEPIRKRLVAKYGRSCWLCGKGIADEDVITIDHVKPLAQGGSCKFDNLRPAHERCNMEKAAGPPPELLLTSDMMREMAIG